MPLNWLPDRIAPSVRSAMKGEARADVEAVTRAALCEAAFLFFLHLQANARVLQEWRALHLNLALLFADYQILQAGRRPAATAAAKRHTRWRSAIEAAVVELCALTGAMDQLAARYFRGHAVLFPQAAEGLARCVAAAETLAEMHHEAIVLAAYPRNPAGKAKQALIDVEVLKTAAAEGADRLAEELSALARAETLALMGEDYAIAEIIQPYVDGSTGGA